MASGGYSTPATPPPSTGCGHLVLILPHDASCRATTTPHEARLQRRYEACSQRRVHRCSEHRVYRSPGVGVNGLTPFDAAVSLALLWRRVRRRCFGAASLRLAVFWRVLCGFVVGVSSLLVSVWLRCYPVVCAWCCAVWVSSCRRCWFVACVGVASVSVAFMSCGMSCHMSHFRLSLFATFM